MQQCIESLNIYDDIIIFGRDQDKPDTKLGCFKMSSTEAITSECEKRKWGIDFKILDK